MLFEPSIEDLVIAGIIEVSGVDPKTGNFLYNFTGDYQNVGPEIYRERMDEMQSQVLHFWRLGFLELDNPQSPNPTVTLSEKAFDEEAIASMPPHMQQIFLEIKRLFER